MTPALCDALAVTLAMTFPSFMSWLEFLVLPGSDLADQHGLGGVFALGKLVQFAFPVVYVRLTRPELLRFRWPGAQGMLLGLAFGLGVGAAICGLYFGWLRDNPVLAGTPVRVYQFLLRMDLASPAGFLLIAGFVAILHSFLEEYYWRWFVFGWLKRHLPLGAALVLSGAAFMAHHVIVLAYYLPGNFWTTAVPLSLGVAGGGVAWAWLYHQTRSLLATWISHLIVDLAIMGVGYDMLSGQW